MGASLGDLRGQVDGFWNTDSNSKVKMVIHSLKVEEKMMVQVTQEWPAIAPFAGKKVAPQIHEN